MQNPHVLSKPASSSWRQSLASRGYKTADNTHLKVRPLNDEYNMGSASCMALSDRGDGENDIIIQTESNDTDLQVLLAKPRDYQRISKATAPAPVHHLDWVGNCIMMACDDGNVFMHRVEQKGLLSTKNMGELECTQYNHSSLKHTTPITPSPEQYTPSSRITRVHVQPNGRRDVGSAYSSSDSYSTSSSSSSSSSRHLKKKVNAGSHDTPTKFLSLENHRLHIWQMEKTNAPISSVKGSNAPLLCAAWNEHDTNQVIIGGVSRSLKVLDIRAMNGGSMGSSLVAWKCDGAHTDSIRDVQWNPMIPHWIASAGADNIINIWDTRYNSGLPIVTLEGHDNIVKKVSWSRYHCEILVSGGIDHQMKLWSLKVEPHYILATVNQFNDTVCNVECSRTKALYYYGMSSAGELMTVEATPMFMTPLVFSRFSEEEAEERNAESILYYRLLKNGFSKVLNMAQKCKEENNLEKALRLLELCKERPLPHNRHYFDEFNQYQDSINRFKKEVKEFSYYLPPNVRGLSDVPTDMMKQVDNLILNCQILRNVQRTEFTQVVALEDKMLKLLQQDTDCIERKTIQDVINLYLAHDYRKGMNLVISIGQIFAKKDSFNKFDPISKKILSPTTFDVSNNPSLQENAYRVLQKTLSNPNFILSQLELQRDVVCALWENNSAKHIVDLVDNFITTNLQTDIISVSILRTYFNALLCMNQLDKFFIECTEMLQSFQGHDFAIIVKGLMRDVAAVKLKNMLMKQFGIGQPATNANKKIVKPPTRVIKKPPPVQKKKKRRGSTSSSNSDSDDTKSTSSSESESESDDASDDDDQEFFARNILHQSNRLSESVAVKFFTECKSGVIITLNIAKFCSTMPAYLQQTIKEALDVIEKCIQKICKIFDDSFEEACRFARDVLRKCNMLHSEAEEQESQSDYYTKAIKVENILMEFLKLDAMN